LKTLKPPSVVLEKLKQIQQGYYLSTLGVQELRPSLMPFCPLIYGIDQVNYKRTTDKNLEINKSAITLTEVPFSQGFYTKVGNAVHDVWQNTAAHTLPYEFVGNWRCNRILESKIDEKSIHTHKCNHLINEATSGNINLRLTCPHKYEKCSSLNFHHEEMEMEWRGIKCHVDGLFKVKNKGKTEYHLVDWKSTGLFLFDKPEIAARSKYYPSKKYIEQIETYALFLFKVKKIKIKTINIAYTSRERSGADPKKPGLHVYSQQMDNRLFTNRKNILLKYVEMKRLANLWLKNPSKENREILFNSRPCKKRVDYYNNMAHRFFEKEPCEFHERGDCYGKNPKMLKILKQLEV